MNYLCVFTKWISYTLSVPAVNLREGFFFFLFPAELLIHIKKLHSFPRGTLQIFCLFFCFQHLAKEEKVESRVIQKQNHPNYGDYLIVFDFYPSDLRF